MPESDYRSLDDADLARLVAVGDGQARAEVRRRFAPVAVLVARRICTRIAHRGRRCPGFSCGHAFVWVYLDLLDRYAGHDPAPGRRGRTALIVTWVRRRRRSPEFADYAFGPTGEGLRGTLTDGRRAWNQARGLRVRPYAHLDLRAKGPDRYRELVADGPLARAAELLGMERPVALWRWVDALFVDACETGLEDPIDVARVARYLLGRDAAGEPPLLRAVGLLAEAVDSMLALYWPAWYDEYLSRPRQPTRRTTSLSPDGGRPFRNRRQRGDQACNG
jgi:hypothetical protein